MSNRAIAAVPALLAALLTFAADRVPAETTPSEIDSLRTKLKSELTYTRRLAVEKLGRLGADASGLVPDLVLALQQDKDDMVRTRSAWALGEIKQPVTETTAALLTATGDPNSGVRSNAFGALLAIGAPAVPSLEQALAAKEARTRVTALRALLALGRRPVETDLVLLQAAFDDPSPEIRQMAAGCAATAGPAAAPLIPPLIGLLDDADAGVREATVAALAKVDRQGASEAALIRALDKDDSKGVKRLVATVLGKVGNPTAQRFTALTKAFGSSDETVRANAADAVAGLGVPAVTPLLEALPSANKQVRELALDALLKLGPSARTAVDPILALLRDEPAPTVRFRAAGALGAIGDASPKVLEALEELAANDKDETVRAHAAAALKNLNSAPANPARS